MDANKLLTQCFKCKNIVSCWGLDRKECTSNKNRSDVGISIDNVCTNLKRLNPKTLNDFMVYSIMIYVQAVMTKENSYIREQIAHTSVCVIEGLTGTTSNISWDCPDAFKYTPADE